MPERAPPLLFFRYDGEGDSAGILRTKKKDLISNEIRSFMVAGAGLEPTTLRVMSPTSYSCSTRDISPFALRSLLTIP